MTKGEEYALIRMRKIVEEEGIEYLLSNIGFACGCMGPDEGETKCPVV